jgi:hypothetical protein
MAAAERIGRGYLGRTLRLTLLAPDIVEAILDGRQVDGVGLSSLMEPFPLEWAHQRDLNGRVRRNVGAAAFSDGHSDFSSYGRRRAGSGPSTPSRGRGWPLPRPARAT